MKKYDSLQNVTIDTLFTREQSEAEYLDGPKGWVRLLQQNLNPNIPVDNGARAGLYTVIVKFIVNADGSISDIALENDPGYGMGKEALRVIKLAKKWKPAVEFGKIVKAYRRQPISFQIEEEKRRRLF
ncbi:MAG: energy transducer TonB [Ferruginibacter sp.]|nr:energy transducer TonB [Ferruginibacter sp.]